MVDGKIIQFVGIYNDYIKEADVPKTYTNEDFLSDSDDNEIVGKNINEKYTLFDNSKPKKNKRKYIPKAVKESVWKKYISQTELKGNCFIGCGTKLQINNFEVGHVIALSNGGKNTIENLRPICSLCNKSMGASNMDNFILDFGFKDTDDLEKELEENNNKIINLVSLIKKKNKSIGSLNKKQQTINEEIETMEELICNTKLQLEAKKTQIEQNETKIIDIETIITVKNEEKILLEKNNISLIEKKEMRLRDKILEEEILKDEIRKELLLEQKKSVLKKQVMKEMGLC